MGDFIAFLYLILLPVAWPVASIAIAKWYRDDGGRLDSDDLAMATLGGAIAAMIWPVALVGYGVYRFITRYFKEGRDGRAEPKPSPRLIRGRRTDI